MAPPLRYGFSCISYPPPAAHFLSLYFCAVALSLWDQVSQHTQSTVNNNEGWVRLCLCVCLSAGCQKNRSCV